MASGVNVKLMMLAKAASNTGESDYHGLYAELGGLNYALKAKQRGVNVVAISNSWCNPGRGNIYDGIVERLGEEGVITFLPRAMSTGIWIRCHISAREALTSIR